MTDVDGERVVYETVEGALAYAGVALIAAAVILLAFRSESLAMICADGAPMTLAAGYPPGTCGARFIRAVDAWVSGLVPLGAAGMLSAAVVHVWRDRRGLSGGVADG